MKKKGFTLIELLAVIVILAIIALIATPLVLKYIEKSRKESKVDSAYSFVRNLETEIANYSIQHNGEKYNGQPSDKGYYELESFTGSEIDTTVKGDTPDSIKVCLSSLGQVEKAMFEYGKYYVSYDGKKGSISDSDTYSNFSCSGSGGNNDSNGNITSEIVFDDTNVTIVEVQPGTFYQGEMTDVEPFTYDIEHYYNLYVDDVAYKGFFVQKYLSGAYLTQLIGRTKYGFMEYNGQKGVVSYDSSTVGPHKVRLEKTSEIVYPYAVKIGSFTSSLSKRDFRIHIISRNFKIADTTVVVKDAAGNVIEEDSFLANSEQLQSGQYLTLILYSEEAYNLAQQGNALTVEVTQVIDGKNITTVLGGSPFTKTDGTYQSIGCELFEYYYWGNELLPGDMNGC